MRFYQINPQTIGWVGDDAVEEDMEARPVIIHKLQIDLEFWPDDDLVEAGLYGYCGTTKLMRAIKEAELTGVDFDKVEVIEGEQFFIQRKSHPNTELPELHWFKFYTGIPGTDDFGLLTGPVTSPLVVSEKALVLLKSFNHQKMEIKGFDKDLLSSSV